MKTVLVDTSVWMSHFRDRNEVLARLRLQDAVRCHPWVLGEIACGTPPAREQALGDLAALQTVNTASIQELMAFVERECLFGQGCGLVDLGLLASVLLTADAELWTLDKRLEALAKRYGVAFEAPPH